MKLAVKIGPTQSLIIILTGITALVHLFLPGALFKLNGLGYLGLLALYFIEFSFLPLPRNLARWALIGYTALTVVLYIVMQIQSGGAYVSPVGIFVKLVEIALIALLFWDAKTAN
jgi:hypothetical protein